MHFLNAYFPKGKRMNKSNCLDMQSFPFRYTMHVLGGKWKMIILYILAGYETVRYNELQRKIGKITYKTLSVQLKELERDGLINRVEYPQIPPKVEYSLSEKGRSLMPLLDGICAWGHENMPQAYEGAGELAGL